MIISLLLLFVVLLGIESSIKTVKLACCEDLSSKTLTVEHTISNVKIKENFSVLEIAEKSSDSLTFLNTTFEITPADLFEKLPNLTELLIKRTNLKNLQKDFFKNATNLATLSLLRNEIEIIQNGTFEYCENLETLKLDYNAIEIVEPDAFQGLKQMIKLSMKFNKIENLTDTIFRHCKLLRFIYLNGNKIKKISKRLFEFGGLISTVNLSSNEISEIESGALKRVYIIRLSHNRIKEIEINPFSYQLNVDNNNLSKLICPSEHMNLTLLFANNNSLSDWTCITKMAKLRSLEVNFNPDLIPHSRHFAKLENLERLAIVNSWESLRPAAFCGALNLQRLAIDEFESYDDVKVALPNIGILEMNVGKMSCSYYKKIGCILGQQEIRFSVLDNCSRFPTIFYEPFYFESDINEDLRKNPPNGYRQIMTKENEG